MVKLLRDSLGGVLPPGQARALETGIDIIGDIAIVKLGEEAKESGPVVGEAIMASMKNVRAVFDQEGGLEGDYRLRRLRLIAGENRTLTLHKVDMRPEATDPPIAGRKDLIVNVEEQNTGNFMLGAGFSSVDALVGYVEITQGNVDLFHPPTFTGAGQKLRLFVQLGTERQDYELSFVEPWFLNRKLALGVDLYRHQLDFESPNNIYDETRTGIRLSLTRALWSDFFIGSINYTLEDVGISLNSGWHGWNPSTHMGQCTQCHPRANRRSFV